MTETQTTNKPYDVICGGIPGYLSDYQGFSLEHLVNLKSLQNPIRLYKYYSNKTNEKGINYSLDALANGTVFLCKAKEYNDAFDCHLNFNSELVENHLIDLFLEAFGSHSSITKSPIEKAGDLYELLSKNKSFIGAHQIIQYYSKVEPSYMKDNMCGILARTFSEYGSLTKEVFVNSFLQNIHDYITDVFPNLLQEQQLCCFSSNNSSQLMWAHYADSHRGFCLEYHLPEIKDIHDFEDLMEWEKKTWTFILPVAYLKERIPVTDQICMLLQEIPDIERQLPFYKYGYLAKSWEWQYENEWRFIYPFTVKEYHPHHVLSERMVDDNNMKFFPISAVYLGCKMENNEKERVIKAVNQHNNEIKIYQGNISTTDYKIEFTRIK